MGVGLHSVDGVKGVFNPVSLYFLGRNFVVSQDYCHDDVLVSGDVAVIQLGEVDVNVYGVFLVVEVVIKFETNSYQEAHAHITTVLLINALV